MASHAISVTKSSSHEDSSSANAPPPLEGSCSCGRNQYKIHLPSLTSSRPEATLVIDTSLTSRQTHSTPLPTFLRIPLSSLHSTTHAIYPAESHAEIRRVFTPAHAPRTKRHFCGFCGTQLSFWREDSEDRSVEEFVYVNLGTLADEDVDKLEESGVLGAQADDGVVSGGSGGVLSHTKSGVQGTSGQPWFEELIRDTQIGRIRQARGGQVSGDGRSRFEWQVVEFDGEPVGLHEDYADDEIMGGVESGASTNSPSKRKVDDMAE